MSVCHTTRQAGWVGELIARQGARMSRRIGCKLLIAIAAGLLGVLPASACDGCACGGAGYGYYGYGPSWGYSSAYVRGAGVQSCTGRRLCPRSPRLLFRSCLQWILRARLRLRLLPLGRLRLARTLVDCYRLQPARSQSAVMEGSIAQHAASARARRLADARTPTELATAEKPPLCGKF